MQKVPTNRTVTCRQASRGIELATLYYWMKAQIINRSLGNESNG